MGRVRTPSVDGLQSFNQFSNTPDPRKMVLGRNVVLPLEAVIGKPQQTGSTDEQCEVDEYISQLQNP